MKSCPVCKKKFEDTVSFCPQDNEVLEDDLSAMVGQTLDGQYLIEKMLGQGGMGAVFLARHTLLGDRVAIKVMPTSLGKNPEYQRRFLREGQAARRFHHPNVITVHDLRSTSDGTLYMVLEFIDGNSLNDELKKLGRFTPAEAIKILQPIAEALDTAHANGIIHRDLKPDNIMIGKTDAGISVVKLLDLGIAKVNDVDVTALTMAGQILGTPHYMSPEQWNGENLDGRADIYSLGIVVYELVNGRRPFEGRSLENLACQHALTVPPPLIEKVKGVPAGFSQAVARAMEKVRDKRQRTCRELFDQLRAAVQADAGLHRETQQAATLINIEGSSTLTPTEFKDKQSTHQNLDPQQASTLIRDEQAATLNYQARQSDPDTNNSRPANTSDDIGTLNTNETAIKGTNAGGNKSPTGTIVIDRDEPGRGDTLSTLKVDSAEQNSQSTSDGNHVQTDRRVDTAGTKKGLPIVPIAAVVLILLSIGGYLGWRQLQNNLPVPPSSNGGKEGGQVVESIELMRYWLSVEPINKSQTFSRKAEVTGLPSSQALRLHFLAPQKGYLYFVATGVNNQLTTFLTAKPAAVTGVTSNEITSNQPYNFPNGRDQKGEERLLILDNIPGTETYTIVYSPTPLLTPAFLNAEALKELSAAERKEWEEFRAKNTRLTAQVVNAEKPYAALNLPKTDLKQQPYYFDITIEHR